MGKSLRLFVKKVSFDSSHLLRSIRRIETGKLLVPDRIQTPLCSVKYL